MVLDHTRVQYHPVAISSVYFMTLGCQILRAELLNDGDGFEIEPRPNLGILTSLSCNNKHIITARRPYNKEKSFNAGHIQPNNT